MRQEDHISTLEESLQLLFLNIAVDQADSPLGILFPDQPGDPLILEHSGNE